MNGLYPSANYQHISVKGRNTRNQIVLCISPSSYFNITDNQDMYACCNRKTPYLIVSGIVRCFPQLCSWGT